MSTLYVDNLEPNLGSRVMATGHVVQVKHAIKKDTQSFSGSSSSTFYDISGLSVDITPTSATSQFLIIASVSLSSQTGQRFATRVVGNGSSVGIAQADGSRTRSSASGVGSSANATDSSLILNVLDSPATTNQMTYKVQGWIEGTVTLYVNRSYTNSDSYSVPITVSSMTVMEIAQ